MNFSVVFEVCDSCYCLYGSVLNLFCEEGMTVAEGMKLAEVSATTEDAEN